MNHIPLGLVPATVVLVALAACGGAGEPPANAAGDSKPPASLPESAGPESPGPPDHPVIDVNSPRTLLSPGTYALAPIGPGAGPLAVVDIPEGYLNDGPFLFPVGEGSHTGPAPVRRAVGYWTVTGVFKDPCTKKGGAVDPGPGVTDLADALETQRRSIATRPVPVSVGGYDGVYLELTAPANLDFTMCGLKTFDYWVSDPVGGAYTDQHDLVNHLWIIDVDDDRRVLAIAVAAGVGAAEIEEVTDIVESARFVDAP